MTTPNLNGAYSAKFAGTSTPSTFLVSAASTMLKPAFEAVPAYTDINTGGAQYLVISHPDFIQGLTPLVSVRQAQGLAVKVVNVADIYAQYSGSITDPQAIKDYIAFAAQNLGTQYVLLVGGDTFDYFDYLGLGSIRFVPSMYAATDDLVRFAPADGLYTDIDNDGVQDLPIGRFRGASAGSAHAAPSRRDRGHPCVPPRSATGASFLACCTS